MEPDTQTINLPNFIVGRAAWLIPARVDTPELLDQGGGSLRDVQASLADLRRINRYLGGFTAITRHLYPRLQALESTATIADMGTGSADIPQAIASWAQRRDIRVRVIGVDLAGRHLALAQQRTRQTSNISLVQADANHLPFKPNAIDYIISSLFLHHFTPDQAVYLLRQIYALARRGIIISDLTRGWLPLVGFKLGQPVFARSYITRYDGAVSVRRAYTPRELLELARAAGIPHPCVYRSWAWRMTLVADK
ncbi:MAG: methyltransferase domain-containing protein [Chloroflexi bacterium]|nr:methyltransferase domain-containing protein [Chloroflexota bacterium]